MLRGGVYATEVLLVCRGVGGALKDSSVTCAVGDAGARLKTVGERSEKT